MATKQHKKESTKKQRLTWASYLSLKVTIFNMGNERKQKMNT